MPSAQDKKKPRLNIVQKDKCECLRRAKRFFRKTKPHIDQL